jgi:hypothetical protein
MRRVVFKARFLWLVCFALLAGAWPIAAQAAGPADGFAVLAGTALSCTDSNVDGLTGIASSFVVASTRCNMPVQVVGGPTGAFADFTARYGAIAASPGFGCAGDPTHILTGTLASRTLLPGTYCFTAAATLTGTLNLTGGGPWILQIGTTGGAFTTTNFTVVSDNPCNAVWWVNKDVTLTTSAFQGTILGGGAITLTGTSLAGGAWATGAMTMTGSHIFGCSGTVLPGTTPTCLAAQQALDVAKAQDVIEDASERAHAKPGSKDAKDKDGEDRGEKDSNKSSNADKREDKAEAAHMRALERAVRVACGSHKDGDSDKDGGSDKDE